MQGAGCVKQNLADAVNDETQEGQRVPLRERQQDTQTDDGERCADPVRDAAERLP